MEPGPGGVGHHHLGAHALPEKFGEDVAHLAREEPTVLDPVRPGVALGVLDGGGDDLDPVHRPRPARQDQADRSGAGIEVEHRLAAG